MNDKYNLNYHLTPVSGWLNDPNGLCQFNGIFHLFYQFAFDPKGGKKYWGHFTTKDFIHYKKEPIAIHPDSDLDRDGVYSGSCFIENDEMNIYYTGNIKYDGEYDYINEGRGHYVNLVKSRDGVNFSNKINILKNSDYPSDMSCHVRDPKIFKENDVYYMVLGARTKDSVGCILMYESLNLLDWNYKYRVNYDMDYGYMWECPDLINIDGDKYLLFCPQGLESQEYRYQSIYQNGYCKVNGSIDDQIYLEEFHELDYGFDFYAPQTFYDDRGRLILIAWMGIPDAEYTNPTVDYGWQHCLTLPREITSKDGKLYQNPIDEIEQLYAETNIIQLKKNRICSYKSNSSKIEIDINNRCFILNLRRDTEISYDGKVLRLSFGASGCKRLNRKILIDDLNTLEIYLDISSIEIFVNNGEYTMSSRVYDELNDTNIISNIDIRIKHTILNSFTIE